jgi:hypothetical protein
MTITRGLARRRDGGGCGGPRPRPRGHGRRLQRKVVDGRHALDSDAYRAAGWGYRAPGGPTTSRTVEPATSEADRIGLSIQVDLAAELLQATPVGAVRTA